MSGMALASPTSFLGASTPYIGREKDRDERCLGSLEPFLLDLGAGITVLTHAANSRRLSM